MKKSQEIGAQCLRKSVSRQGSHQAIVSPCTDSHSQGVSLHCSPWTVLRLNMEHPPIFFPNCIVPIAKFCLISSAIESYAKLNTSSNRQHCRGLICILSRNTINAFKLPSTSPICLNCSILKLIKIRNICKWGVEI
ncbi:hypothetical protein NC652_032969 [Populus alba x Populus x berolinensis]|nr:hypothetical protein NC651_031949 [Populus alba x Populus x berolinensis]KAJ6872969.1 hypothetical protein NC651_031951 [Populus alba x Populus x berolinensis]KAJ6879533.1 hypothetical protein NC652_032969 [Populus alba x Populus x berolinensis]